MNINRDLLSGSDLGMPSGCEVETAAFHTPVESVVVIDTAGRSGMRGRLDDLKSKGLAKVHGVQRLVSDRTSVMKSSLQTGVNDSMTRMQDSMRTSPMKWAGIAAGSGFAIGMLGRIAHWRNKHRRHMPDLVIIESTC